MRRVGFTFAVALALVAVARAGLADREACKIRIGDDYRYLEGTYTREGCRVEAKKYAGPRVCNSRDQYFDLRYQYDGVNYEESHLHCLLYMGSGAPSASRGGSPSSSDVPPQGSVNGKYSHLLQVVHCPRHVKEWGEFKDYGHWGGGAWCGETGKAGYWVWVNPNWYVWADEGEKHDDIPPRASVDGKYHELVQIVHCPRHVKEWGEFKDYGHWGGGAWCGETGKAGYWVWVNPDWYVWAHER